MTRNEIIKMLDFDVDKLFKSGWKLGISVAIPKLTVDEKLSSELFKTFSDDLITYLNIHGVYVSNLVIPVETSKALDQLREEINHAAAVKGNKLMNKAVVWSQGKGWFNRFNPVADKQNIIELIPLLHEMAIALDK